LFIALVGCGGGSSGPTAPVTPQDTATTTFPGFDTSLYPGDGAMRAWLRPASPYYWTGYYLAAPCHRDESWMGKYTTLSTMGWGITAIYVGQQDWSQIPAAPMNRAVDVPPSNAALVTCSASLLTTQQGLDEAADAAAKMLANGFPSGSIVFLDVEFVTAVTP